MINHVYQICESSFRVSLTALEGMSPNYDISSISGNATPDVKRTLLWSLDPQTHFSNGIRFAQDVYRRLKIVEASCNNKLDEPEKLEFRVVVETTVEQGACFADPVLTYMTFAIDMINGADILHGGCSAYLVDV